jgi:hypothetical protein
VTHDEDDPGRQNADGPQSVTNDSKARLPDLSPHWLHVEWDDTML